VDRTGNQFFAGSGFEIAGCFKQLRGATDSDLLQEQALLATTEDQYRQALLAFWTTRANFEKALGGGVAP
jgi:hypothetical protein